jgi:hypothetical protein
MPAPDEEPVLIWVEPGETTDDALASRYGAGPFPANVLFFGAVQTAVIT